ncbi:glycoside hydrolase family 3 N-terminal domain-containing protein [Neptunicella marina]|uniref:beta-glucosidase n=1 Tax=Neptunicella marina TaxID=2125989 RepID=A0A8J6LW62_9ALTE|nr:glycoside hydrolase family 3 N-terminal domain-containing protein [Neptunicella marina]MBC3765054.1 glycoside hydrolase family 3 C-terminal domain-containing protein [Neptunicella marina]
MKPHYLPLLCSTLALSMSAAASTAIYKDVKQPVEKRVDDLLKRMTLEEKVAQLQTVWKERREMENQQMVFQPNIAQKYLSQGIGQIARPSEFKTPVQAAEFTNAAQHWLQDNTRLGIPAIMHEEALHGFAAKRATSFPQAIALASSWQPQNLKQIYSIAAEEIRAIGAHQALTPILDVARDARWGRIEETMGEDPYLITAMGVAAVEGFQGERETDAPFAADKVIATLKHLTGHGQPTAGVNIAPARIGERELHEVFLTPFEAAVKISHVSSIMASYNEIDGIPSHVNKPLLDQILRNEWHFDGTVVSDYYAITELNTRHHLYEDLAHAAKAALDAGVDVEMPNQDAYLTLADMVKSGHLDEALIDRSVKRILRQKFLLGLFENPFVDVAKADAAVGQQSHREFARQVAEQSMVLLKNSNTLPFDASKIKRLAVIGPHADETLLGGYSNIPRQTVTILDGLKQKLAGKAQVSFARGTRLIADGPEISDEQQKAQTFSERRWVYDDIQLADGKDDKKLMAEAVALANKSDAVVLVLGENEGLSREAWDDNHMGDRAHIELVGNQVALAEAILATGKPVAVVLTNGRPLALGKLAEDAPAIIEAWYLGQETGSAVANVIFGDANPGGKLPLTFPRSAGHIPVFYNHKPSAKRGYLFDDISPLYAFGHGLSYSTFKYTDLTIDKSNAKANGMVDIAMTISNTSARDGDEVVQLYINDPVASATRPVQELKGFQRVSLKTGEAKRLHFKLPVNLLAFYDVNMNWVVEPGKISVMLGSASDDIRLEGDFTITGETTNVEQHKAFLTPVTIETL